MRAGSLPLSDLEFRCQVRYSHTRTNGRTSYRKGLFFLQGGATLVLIINGWIILLPVFSVWVKKWCLLFYQWDS